MNIKVNSPEFLLNVLKDEVVNRTRYLVSQGVAYDSDWRDAFAALFQVIEQLELPTGDKLEEYMNDDNASHIVMPDESYFTMPNGDQVRQEVSKVPTEISLKDHERLLELKYPLGLSVTIGKGKTVWTVDGYAGQTVHLSREGAGPKSKYSAPDKIKFVQNPFYKNKDI